MLNGKNIFMFKAGVKIVIKSIILGWDLLFLFFNQSLKFFLPRETDTNGLEPYI